MISMFNNRLVRVLLNINFNRFTYRTLCSCHELDQTTGTQVYQIDIFSNSAAFEILCINANTVDRISINSNDKFWNVVSFLALARVVIFIDADDVPFCDRRRVRCEFSLPLSKSSWKWYNRYYYYYHAARRLLADTAHQKSTSENSYLFLEKLLVWFACDREAPIFD